MKVEVILTSCSLRIKDIGTRCQLYIKSRPMHLTQEDIDFIKNLDERMVLARLIGSHIKEDQTVDQKLVALQEALVDYTIWKGM